MMGEKLKLLIIDDDDKVTGLVQRIAEGAGYKTYVYDRQTALDTILASDTPDIIFLDVFMPNQDAFDVMRRLKKVGSSAKIIVMSGDGDFCKMAAEYGSVIGLDVATSIEKPFRLREVREALQLAGDAVIARQEKYYTPLYRVKE